MTQAYMAVLAAFFGSLGFALLYNMRGKRILVPAVGGAFFWGFYLVFVQVTSNPYLGFFISAVLLTAYAEVWAIVLKTPVTVPLIPTVIPFIPGGGLYYSVNALLRGDLHAFAGKAAQTMGLALALAVGIMLATSLAKLLRFYYENIR